MPRLRSSFNPESLWCKLPDIKQPSNTINLSLSLSNKITLKDVLDQHKRDILLSINCHAIGTVQSFNPVNQTVTATINYKKTFFDFNPATQQYDPRLVDYPLLVDVPVIVLGGGGTNVTFPVSQGDECLVLFNDRDKDNWLRSGQPGPVATGRLHSLSDGFALVGVNSFNSSLENYDPQRAVLRGGLPVVGVNTENDKILLSNVEPVRDPSTGALTYSKTLNDILQELVNAIKSLKIDLSGVTAGSDTVPLGGSMDPDSVLELSDIADELSDMLE